MRRVNEEFIPVALKAGLVNNPPKGVEGDLYAEIARAKPAPQGICTANSAGKVLAWALSFDDEAGILKFLDHVAERYRQSPDAKRPVTAERFMKFPSRPLENVADNGRASKIPAAHASGVRCPAKPTVEAGTLVGRIIGRALDEDGVPLTDTVKQENYVEARFEIPVLTQAGLAAAAAKAGKNEFTLPDKFARELVKRAYLGQLDVDPFGTKPGSANVSKSIELKGRRVPAENSKDIRILVSGRSSATGQQDEKLSRRTGGRMWEHRVTIEWNGLVDIRGGRVRRLAMLAEGDERLLWGNPRWKQSDEKPVERLMAGRHIDMECGVRYGLIAAPATKDETLTAEQLERLRSNSGQARRRAAELRLRQKMRRMQAGIRRLRQIEGDLTPIADIMREFRPLTDQGRLEEAEALADRALKILENNPGGK